MTGTTDTTAIIRATPGLSGLDEETVGRLALLMEFLIEQNRTTNLTAIRDPDSIALLHFADSLAPLGLVPGMRDARHAADLGSGAGFPALPLAIAMPGCRWHAVESIAKKSRFTEEAARRIPVPNLTAVCARAETYAHGAARESLDIVTSRAVGPLASLCELGVPLLREGGALLLYKTAASREEADAARNAIALLGAGLAAEHVYRLPGDQQDRILFEIRRTGPVPDKYPRSGAIPFKRPLA
jgi:16S rRNA (guanine527-N7)-methyltransferase